MAVVKFSVVLLFGSVSLPSVVLALCPNDYRHHNYKLLLGQVGTHPTSLPTDNFIRQQE